MEPLPRSLDEWTLDTIKYLVNRHAHEPQQFDFKEVLNSGRDERDEMNASIVRTVCSMANSSTGHLIFGVQDFRRESKDPLERICGIPINGEHRSDFAKKVQAIQPEIHFDAISQLIPLESDSSRGVFVVRIPLSPLRPHMDSKRGIFYTRGDGGNARHMNWTEVRDQMLLTEERRQQVTLLRLKLVQFREQCSDFMKLDDRELIMEYGRLETGGFEALLASVCAVIELDREVLLSLLAVPTGAQALNRILDRWQHADRFGHRVRDHPDSEEAFRWLEQVHSTAFRIEELCEQCEFPLRLQFGPLVGDEEMEREVVERLKAQGITRESLAKMRNVG
jgi:hypothetical protein